MLARRKEQRVRLPKLLRESLSWKENWREYKLYSHRATLCSRAGRMKLNACEPISSPEMMRLDDCELIKRSKKMTSDGCVQLGNPEMMSLDGCVPIRIPEMMKSEECALIGSRRMKSWKDYEPKRSKLKMS
jgi:hypothetical protein